MVGKGLEKLVEHYNSKYTLAGTGWLTGGLLANTALHGFALAERVDDYCAAAFVYTREAQSVPRVNVNDVIADIGLRPYEKAPRGPVAGAT